LNAVIGVKTTNLKARCLRKAIGLVSCGLFVVLLTNKMLIN